MSPALKPKRKPIKSRIANAALIKLTKGLACIVDKRDAEWVCKRNWCCNRRGRKHNYAVRNGIKDKGRSIVFLHADVWERHRGEVPAGKQIHHRNGNSLDNRLENLEALSIRLHGSLKIWNRNGLPRGVAFFKGRRKPFVARIGFNSKSRTIGYFATPEEAHQAYLKKWSYLHRHELKAIGRPVLVSE